MTMTDLLVAIKEAGQQDLDAINERLDELNRERDALMDARKIIERRVNGKPSKRTSAAASNQGDSELAKRMYAELSRRGPLPVKQLAASLKVSWQKLARFNHEWFVKDDQGRIAIAKLDG